MTGTAIVTHAIERRFGAKTAVDGVDLAVQDGEVYGFLGPNGAGKSTLTRMLCTLLAPTRGGATVAGHDVVHDPTAVRLRIGVALQEAALDDKQTGVEMLRLQGRFYGLTARETRRRVAELRELIDIGDALDDRVATYSGGMKRRLDLALALVHNPRVLFLDEPTTGLDPLSRAAVWTEVRRLNDELGMTVFLTTQYLEEADALADRVGIINRGAIVAEGTPDELKRSIGTDVLVVDVGDEVERARSTLAGLTDAGVGGVEIDGSSLMVSVDDGARAVSPIALALDRDGVAVRELALRRPTLDDVFFRVTGQRIQGEEGEVA
ncbi:ABC-2 type transport system ATP-binding protein [Isoptericola jiangsuensis]|uniref:ABC-2 type transport system ATP-binding protein n=1 Tax=Isoptericola jiangsuensis TaxID=548579 RepID=A0A2A9ETL0_9MICO|nr:ATP-binding cassette domain-containing protein [Isoptericola jiangsuensis]PFG41575.1 ABC-2 type transport system ATP-binding protein [Isoptericola jiangsuensis]